MIPRRVEEPPAPRLGVGPLVIVEHDPGEVAQLAVPLALRQQEPVEGFAQAAFQGLREERLRRGMAIVRKMIVRYALDWKMVW